MIDPRKAIQSLTKYLFIFIIIALGGCGGENEEPKEDYLEDTLYFKGTVDGEEVTIKSNFSGGGDGLYNTESDVVFKSISRSVLLSNTDGHTENIQIHFGGFFPISDMAPHPVTGAYIFFRDSLTFINLFENPNPSYLPHMDEELSETLQEGVAVTAQFWEGEGYSRWVSYDYPATDNDNVDFTVTKYEILKPSANTEIYKTQIGEENAVLVEGTFSCRLYNTESSASFKIENAQFRLVFILNQ